MDENLYEPPTHDDKPPAQKQHDDTGFWILVSVGIIVATLAVGAGLFYLMVPEWSD